MGWITTRTGNRILIGEDESLEEAIKSYYQVLEIKPTIKLSSKEDSYVKSNIRHSGNRFIGENVSTIVLPPNDNSGSYNMYIFTHSNGKIENARVKIVDAIDHDKLEAMDDYFNRRF